jgi:hypothetical protein
MDEGERRRRWKRERSSLTITYATGGRPEDTVYVMKPSRAQTIPLTILDLTWVNADGVARLNSTHAGPSNLLSLSQQEARKKMKPNDTERYPTVTILGFKLEPRHAKEQVAGVGEVNSLEYPLRRTWRFTRDYAAAALLAFTQHMARPAFEHDFLRGWVAGEDQSSTSHE